MNELKEQLVKNATREFSSIYPPSARRDFAECFTIEGNKLYFWFNTADNTTHLIATELAG